MVVSFGMIPVTLSVRSCVTVVTSRSLTLWCQWRDDVTGVKVARVWVATDGGGVHLTKRVLEHGFAYVGLIRHQNGLKYGTGYQSRYIHMPYPLQRRLTPLHMCATGVSCRLLTPVISPSQAEIKTH
jgi:hypothetical protein